MGDPQDRLTDYQWLTHPDNISGCPAIYGCRECGEQFRWFEVDGEAGPHCVRCAKRGMVETWRPILLARNSKYEYMAKREFNPDRVESSASVQTQYIAPTPRDLLVLRFAIENHAESTRRFIKQFDRNHPDRDTGPFTAEDDLRRCELMLERIKGLTP